MDAKKITFFKELLLKEKTKILNGSVLNSTDDLKVASEDLPDEGDLANNVINQQVSFSMRNRELAKLRQIEGALSRIDEGSYGACDECDEDIADKRLKNQPWTDLCITHAEERERGTSHFRKIG